MTGSSESLKRLAAIHRVHQAAMWALFTASSPASPASRVRTTMNGLTGLANQPTAATGGGADVNRHGVRPPECQVQPAKEGHRAGEVGELQKQREGRVRPLEEDLERHWPSITS